MNLWGTSGKSLRAILICILLNFICCFDINVLVSSHPIIADYFDCNFTFTLWLSVTITISLIIFSPLSIDLVDKYGKRNGAMIGLVIIIAGSIISLISSEFNIYLLIFSRMVTGIGIAFMCTSSIITDNVDKKYLPETLAISFSMSCFGSAIGPIVGQYLSNAIGWQFIFIPLTITFVVLIFVLSTIDNVVVDSEREINYVPHILFIVSVGMMVNSIFMTWEHVYVFFIGLILLIVFIYDQRKSKKYIIDISIFKNDLFRLSIFMGLLFLFSTYCIDDTIALFMEGFNTDLVIVIGPLIISSALLSAILRGLKPTIQFIASPLVARLNRGKSPMRLTRLAFALMLIVPALYVLQNMIPDYGITALLLIIIYVILSLSTAIFSPQNKSIIMSCVESFHRNTAAALISLVENTGRCLGLVLNVYIFGLIFDGDELGTYSVTTMIVVFLTFVACALGFYLATKRKNDFQ